MFKKTVYLLILLSFLALTACSLNTADTGDTNTDAAAVQNFLPDIAGYDKRDVDFAQDALATTLQGAGVLTGNLIGAALVNRFNTLVNCYQERGAVDARIYTQRLSDAVSGAVQGQIPIGGFLAVINVNRVEENFLSCAVQNPLSDAFSAQSVEPEPCVGTGSLTFEGDTISFVFAATDTPLCDAFAQYFNGRGASTTVSPVQLPGS